MNDIQAKMPGPEVRRTVLVGMLLAGISAGVSAGDIGPDSSWDAIAGHPFYQARVPTIAFHAISSNGVGSALVMRKAHQVSRYTAEDGREMLYGGTVRVCDGHDNRGSRSDQACVSWERVELHRSVQFESWFCDANDRTDDDCGRWQLRQADYPLEYEVAVYRRVSESDAFSHAGRPAFVKTIRIPQLSQ